MKKRWFVFTLMAAVFILARQDASTKSQTVTAPPPNQQAIMDVAFCLDTTGSMSGLLEGAKTKIWSIVNTISKAKPRPVLRIALVGYRDLNDTYVTRVYDFTTNLETMYGHLREFHADGGGDTPEHVNQALHESINKLSWSKNPAALKILYLVGDALPNTQQVWQEIARMAEGKYATIDQTGGMVNINSPYDTELARLSGELNKTYVAYGESGRADMAAQSEHDTFAASAPTGAAERATAKASILYRNESWDLVDAIKEDERKLDKLSKDELPSELRGLSRDQQKNYLQKKEGERANLQKRIQNLAKKRESFIEEEKKKPGAKKDSFDAQVLSTLKEQGKNKGISFE